MAKLVSASILHRHGARGPGHSEIDRLSDSNPAKSQWQESEIENITCLGHDILKSLGAWFAIYVKKMLINDGESLTPDDILWRVSKSERARESGDDFVNSFNNSIGAALITEPLAFGENADAYFRPWKIFVDEVNAAKSDLMVTEEWANKVAEHENFLLEIAEIADLKDKGKPAKILWAMTHLLNLLECESWWFPLLESGPDADSSGLDPSKAKLRNHLLIKLANVVAFRQSDLELLESLACWVWDRRFLKTKHSFELGGKLSLDILQRIVDGTPRKICVYSGHDYTLMSVMAALGLLESLPEHLGFGCYLLFELWEGSPPPFTADTESPTSQLEPLGSLGSSLTLRIVLNTNPFSLPRKYDVSRHSFSATDNAAAASSVDYRSYVSTHFEQLSVSSDNINNSSNDSHGSFSGHGGPRVLAELSLQQLSDRLDAIRSHLQSLPSPGGFGPVDEEKQRLKALEKLEKAKTKANSRDVNISLAAVSRDEMDL